MRSRERNSGPAEFPTLSLGFEFTRSNGDYEFYLKWKGNVYSTAKAFTEGFMKLFGWLLDKDRSGSRSGNSSMSITAANFADRIKHVSEGKLVEDSGRKLERVKNSTVKAIGFKKFLTDLQIERDATETLLSVGTPDIRADKSIELDVTETLGTLDIRADKSIERNVTETLLSVGTLDILPIRTDESVRARTLLKKGNEEVLLDLLYNIGVLHFDRGEFELVDGAFREALGEGIWCDFFYAERESISNTEQTNAYGDQLSPSRRARAKIIHSLRYPIDADSVTRQSERDATETLLSVGTPDIRADKSIELDVTETLGTLNIRADKSIECDVTETLPSVGTLDILPIRTDESVEEGIMIR